MDINAKLEAMYNTPGFWWLGSYEQRLIVEVENGVCHQLNRGYKRDGALSRDGWNCGPEACVVGPFATAELAEKDWENCAPTRSMSYRRYQ